MTHMRGIEGLLTLGFGPNQRGGEAGRMGWGREGTGQAEARPAHLVAHSGGVRSTAHRTGSGSSRSLQAAEAPEKDAGDA